ncbi:hypothetical protein NDN08_003439 [Rhodosorus marinus]|uniref:Ribosomal RNA small subunit methyltransferase G n=1 Tax=Rhodosorus marinus TaxID=101924 RepID=A0AAV8V2F8_9RHOD|nr:hypothetical protein NDN08_003439 [Rhodosorus marinus]
MGFCSAPSVRGIGSAARQLRVLVWRSHVRAFRRFEPRRSELDAERSAPRDDGRNWIPDDSAPLHIASKFFFENAKKYGLGADQEIMFKEFAEFLISYNEKVNLTGLKELSLIYSKHYLNSLVLFPVLNELRKQVSSFKLIDVGSGAGIPGIPIAIMRPDFQVTLNDATKKKCTFHALAIEKLGLSNAQSVWARAEDLGHVEEYREQYDLTIARSVAEMTTLVELTLPLTRVGGHFVAMKSIEPGKAELKNARNAIRKLGGEILEIKYDPYHIPESNGRRMGVVVVEKLRETDFMYPRAPGVPTKQPLKR